MDESKSASTACRCASCADDPAGPDRSEDGLDAWEVGALDVVLDRSGNYPYIHLDDEGERCATLDRLTAQALGRALLNAAEAAGGAS